jgi:serine/threonine-protein kinase
MSRHIGQQIAGYVLTHLIGEGGTAWVYRAEHPGDGRQVAVKVLRPELSLRPQAVSRFLSEAEVINRIAHPNIVEALDVGTTEDGVTYLVMELLTGRALSELVRCHGPVPLAHLLSIGRQLTDALGAAHHAGIIHRDLKPDNIYIVTRGDQTAFVKMLDFGMAKILRDAPTSHATAIGAVFGTPRYMSPEQCGGGTVDQRTDVYSLGLVLYLMATGQLPFADVPAGELLFKHQRVASLIDDTFGGPPELARVIERATDQRPAARFASMEDMDQALAACLPLVQGTVAPLPDGPATVWPPPFPADQATLLEP